jgi:mRNA interferase MazF
VTSTAAYVPECGDVVWVTLSPQAGHEPAGRRPALILSPASCNGRTKMAVVCPITSKTKGYRFEVRIPKGLPVKGVILADQIRNIDWLARKAECIGSLPQATVLEVTAKLVTLLPVSL